MHENLVPLRTEDGRLLGNIHRHIVMHLQRDPTTIAECLIRAPDSEELIKRLMMFQANASEDDLLRLHPLLHQEIDAIKTTAQLTPEEAAFEAFRTSEEDDV